MKKNIFCLNLVLLITSLFASQPLQAASKHKEDTDATLNSIPHALIASKILPFCDGNDMAHFSCSSSATADAISAYLDQIKSNPDFASLSEPVKHCFAQLIAKKEIIPHPNGHYIPISPELANQICTHAYTHFATDDAVLDACWTFVADKIIEYQVPFRKALNFAAPIVAGDRDKALSLLAAAEEIADATERALSKMAVRIIWRLRNINAQIRDASDLDELPINEMLTHDKAADGNNVIIVDFASLLPFYPDPVNCHQAIQMMINLVTTYIDADKTLANPAKKLTCALHLRNLGDVYTVPQVVSLKLDTLVLNNNQITTLSSIVTPALKMLAACNNQLTTLEFFYGCVLNKLFVSDNQIENFYGFKTPGLIELYATGNAITTLNGLHTPYLKFLAVSNNALQNFEGCNTPRIEALHANNNAITSLSGLCKDELRVLNVNNNRLTNIANLSDAEALTHLYINHNPGLSLAGFFPAAGCFVDVCKTGLSKREIAIFARNTDVGYILDSLQDNTATLVPSPFEDS